MSVDASFMRVQDARPDMPRHGLAVELCGMTKRFGPLTALDDVSMRVPSGAFHALLGENGAGKSTLVKCLVGFHPPDAGEVVVDGRQQVIRSPHHAHALGIGMVYQHFTLVPSMTVAENLVMSRADVPAVVRWSRELERLRAFMDTVPFRVPLDRPVSRLAAGEKQKVEILKQLYLQRRFMILDEPTSVLTLGEADEVLGMLRTLTRERTLTVLMITHKFREVMGFADTVSVLRRGRLAGEGRVADLDPERLASMMLGERATAASVSPAAVAPQSAAPALSTASTRPAAATASATPADTAADSAGPAPSRAPTATPEGAASSVAGEGMSVGSARPAASHPRLAVRALRVRGDSGALAVEAFTVDIAPGEIVGIAGVSGNGQRELVEALVGQRDIDGGEVSIDGQHYRPTREHMRRHRVFSLPEEPLRNACVAGMSVAENMALRNFDVAPISTGAWLRPAAMQAQAERLIRAFKVKAPGPGVPIATLSGGNVQRAVLARELSADVRVLIVANPIFGLDFAAVAEIHQRIRAVRESGAAVLMVSEDLDELLEISDRVLVMSGGRVMYETPAAGADIALIGQAMAGQAIAQAA